MPFRVCIVFRKFKKGSWRRREKESAVLIKMDPIRSRAREKKNDSRILRSRATAKVGGKGGRQPYGYTRELPRITAFLLG